VLLDAEFYVESKNIFIGSASLNLLWFALFFVFLRHRNSILPTYRWVHI